jgi:hypothetical protein
MAYMSDFSFNSMGRIGNDACYKTQEEIQNIESCNYLLKNYFTDCSMYKTIDLATSQPCVNYMGRDQSCYVDNSSRLLIGTIQTHPKCKIDLFHRPFATVPYLGRGSVDSILESQIQQGELLTNRRSVSHLTEKCYIKYHNTPMLQPIRDRITNPEYCVEGVASEGWIRGGIPSRDLTRDRDVNASNTYN